MKAEACPRAIDTDRVETPRSFVTSRRVGGARRHELVFQRVRCSRASGGVGADLVRWAIWSASALLLAIASFAAGRFSSFRPLPEIVATLPGDESEFSREFDDRVRERFPIGSSEDQLLTFLPMKVFFPTGGVATIRMRASSLRADSYARKSFVCSGAPTWLGLSRTSAAHMKAGAYDRFLTKSRTSPA